MLEERSILVIIFAQNSPKSFVGRRKSEIHNQHLVASLISE